MGKTSLRKLGFDLQTLEAFVAVCRTGSMTSAAFELGITQPAVSRSIALLEEKLDIPLFKRNTRPLIPTAAGSRLNEAAARLLIEALALPAIVKGRNRQKLSQLRLGVLDSLSDPFVPLIFKNYREIASSVTVVTGFDDFLHQNMIKHEFDAVISTHAFDDIAGYEQFEIFKEDYIIVAPADVPESLNEDMFRELATRLPLIRLGNTSSMARSIERHLRRMKLTIPETLSCNTVESVLGMVAAGVGWSILTPVCVRKCLHSISQLRLLQIPGQTFNRQIYFAARKNELNPYTASAADMCRTVIMQSYLPELHAITPWMDKAIRIT